ncbi:uncharacterized protein FOMMEDRAFT_154433 [Fomitiporia mediterranea MF3/22]|uniref:uncharacterized protein n=1 Tax=Fomitiporia mediterranea (strain MF3/22) TaxID=694068 RepID=UPI0004408700|nr:uncharacterized protein FOMMEDRAFT_154433 [Fomitiporia mediterranea MF3/22]EJD05218.1 hypothetical protein FOMMEDRAFT_154433 [Fomitiporia mediterranea MF3/22]
MSGVAWTLTAFFEMILFVLTLWKSVQLKRSKLAMDNPRDELPRAEHIITLMARDSIMYFAIIFSICLLGAILVFIADESPVSINNPFFVDFNKFGSNAYQTIVITIVTILAPRMLINLREERYGPVGIIPTALSWDVCVPEHSGLQTTGNIVE